MQVHGQKGKHYNYMHCKTEILLAPSIMLPEFRDHIQEQNNPSTPALPSLHTLLTHRCCKELCDLLLHQCYRNTRAEPGHEVWGCRDRSQQNLSLSTTDQSCCWLLCVPEREEHQRLLQGEMTSYRQCMP